LNKSVAVRMVIDVFRLCECWLFWLKCFLGCGNFMTGFFFDGLCSGCRCYVYFRSDG